MADAEDISESHRIDGQWDFDIPFVDYFALQVIIRQGVRLAVFGEIPFASEIHHGSRAVPVADIMSRYIQKAALFCFDLCGQVLCGCPFCQTRSHTGRIRRSDGGKDV